MTTSSEDIVDMLLAQHHQIKLLFDQIGKAQGEHRDRLFHELVGLLAVHESVEEGLVHPLAERELGAGDAVQERLDEERDAKTALARLYDMGTADPGFEQELTALRDAVAAHAEAEEELEFLRLRGVVEPERLARMGAAMRFVAAGSPTRPGPPPAVFDRVGAALREAISFAETKAAV